MQRFGAPYDWATVDAAIEHDGGVIVTGFVDSSAIDDIGAQVDAYLAVDETRGLPVTGSSMYDRFLGHRTVRLHGLVAKFPATVGLIGRTDLIDWAQRTISGGVNSVLMNASEYIQIMPGEPAQYPHRDSDSWPPIPQHEPIIVNAIVAIDETTTTNGATYIAPGSHRWEPGRRVEPHEWERATMNPGDALLFRGDIVHRGGENNSDARRRVLSLSYCAPWLRTVENSFLNVPVDLVATFPQPLRDVLGYASLESPYGGLIGLYDGGDPTAALQRNP